MHAEMRVITIDVFLFCPVLTKFGVPVLSSVKFSNSNFHENFSSVHTEGQANYQMDLHLRSAVNESPKTYKATTTFALPFHSRVVCTADTGELVQRTVVC